MNVCNLNIKDDMPSRLNHGANAAGDSGAGVDGCIVLHDLVNLPVEDATVEVVQQLLILADNLEMHHRIAHCRSLLANFKRISIQVQDAHAFY